MEAEEAIGRPRMYDWQAYAVAVIAGLLVCLLWDWDGLRGEKPSTRNWYNWPTLYERPGSRLEEDDA